ncbi:hypothetical protein MDA_GLEAN10013711 [Myotis davidii]|uniref:Uncharacterized protein n=1 Tax=Myotis davidii TaxID=225400 RepID=L5MJC2_MYODS|nr:hypothetical protein MDA_GLEAN10013711 [Myotis davidii]
MTDGRSHSLSTHCTLRPLTSLPRCTLHPTLPGPTLQPWMNGAAAARRPLTWETLLSMGKHSAVLRPPQPPSSPQQSALQDRLPELSAHSVSIPITCRGLSRMLSAAVRPFDHERTVTKKAHVILNQQSQEFDGTLGQGPHSDHRASQRVPSARSLRGRGRPGALAEAGHSGTLGGQSQKERKGSKKLSNVLPLGEGHSWTSGAPNAIAQEPRCGSGAAESPRQGLKPRAPHLTLRPERPSEASVFQG